MTDRVYTAPNAAIKTAKVGSRYRAEMVFTDMQIGDFTTGMFTVISPKKEAMPVRLSGHSFRSDEWSVSTRLYVTFSTPIAGVYVLKGDGDRLKNQAGKLGDGWITLLTLRAV